MLTKIRVENYKSFKEAEIPIKPITILLGANSSGKSSMLQLLLLLQQTAEVASYESALKIYGKRISMGKPENLFYKKDSKKPFCIQIDFNNEHLKNYLIDALKSYLGPFRLSFRLLSNKKIDIGSKRVDFEEALDTIINKKNPLLTRLPELSDYYISSSDLTRQGIPSLISTYDFLKQLYNIKSPSFSFTYTVSFSNEQLLVSAFSFKNNDVSILSYSKGVFYSDITELKDTDQASLNEALLQDSTIFNIFGKRENIKKSPNGNETSLSKTMINLITKGLSILQDEFKEPFINHVGPLRAHPQRYYMLDKANVTYSLDTFDANAIAEVIKDKPQLKERVNTWFKQFGLEVTVDVFKEVIHKLTVSQSSLDLDIPDVGFGVSQVLPVVLQGFLSPSSSVTIVEQPEIHLHPKMQAALADLFIDITKESGFTKHLLIETHSEYLLRRLRRRMAQGDGADKGISPNIVSINLFHTRTNDEPATIENIPIENKGAFQWPQEYYDDELSADVVEFLKLQANGDIHSND